MTVTVRFAPSPTGNIHIGNTRTALFNWLYVLKNRGRFFQRFDDTDVARSKQEYANAILYDLHWLGIYPDATYYQSQRFDRYDAAVEQLKATGLLYPCYETAEELDLRRKIRASRKLPPVYGREALALTSAEMAAFEAEGRKPHWRFLLPNYTDGNPENTTRSEVTWNDLVRGEEIVDLASVSDPVLVREDGTYLYTLPSVVDDIDMGITHVIRGDDHVTNTGVQIAIFKALGAVPPEFGHHNLLTTSTGEGLSKRTGALSVGSLREQGIEPMAVASLAVPLEHPRISLRSRRWMRWHRISIRHPFRSRHRSSIRPTSLPSIARCCTRCRSPKRATVWPSSAFQATAPRISGWQCAAISTGCRTPRNGGGS